MFNTNMQKSFAISMWNIQGLNSSAFGLKSLTPEFQERIKNIEMIVLRESWCKIDTVTHCPPEYQEIIVPSIKIPLINHGRDSGGIII